jgi:hypothetical protein
MVLGLSFGKKSRKAKDGGPVIRSSPSLPTLHSQGIPWPENLVDATAVRAVRQEPVAPIKAVGKSAKSLNGDATNGAISIASLYAKASGGITRTLSGFTGHGRTQQRKRVAPTLNVRLRSVPFAIVADRRGVRLGHGCGCSGSRKNLVDQVVFGH